MILAAVTIYQCDNCTTIVCLQTDEDWTDFELMWHDGLKYQFCPECKDKIEAAERIQEDFDHITNFETTIAEEKQNV